MTTVARIAPDSLLLAAMGRTTRVIGYRAAAWLFGLDGIDALQPEFAIPHGSWRRGPHDHQRRRIDDLEIVEVQGLVVTSVSQTLADLCAVVDLDVVERAAESALRKRLTDEASLRAFAGQWARFRDGTPGLQQVLARRPVGSRPTGSDLETIGLQTLRRGGLPEPVRQWPVLDKDGEWVADADFGFPWRLFVVEMDGLQTHKTKEQQQYDLNRQNRISDAGYHFRRFTYADVLLRPGYVCRETLFGLAQAPLASAERRRPICPMTSPIPESAAWKPGQTAPGYRIGEVLRGTRPARRR
jgi:very-short-patch-repair endonuclease